MEYLVTGGAGFIGSNIVRRLIRNGKSVRVLDNLSTGRMENIRDALSSVDFVEGDIRDPEAARKAVKGVEKIFHLAALPSVPRSVEDPVLTHEVNVGGTLNMLLAARDVGARIFVFSSSSSVYGDAPGLSRREDMAPEPVSPYAVQKLIGEYYCRVFRDLCGLTTFSLRYFNVFGPMQDPQSQYAAVVPRFIRTITSGEAPTIYGDGEQTRDFTFVDDVAAANMRCCSAPPEAAGQTFNVARGKRVSVNDLARVIMKIAGKTVEPIYAQARQGDVRDSEGDITKARALLGWEPGTTLEEGLRTTVEYFKTRNPGKV